MRMIAYNMRQGGSRDPAVWARVLPDLAPDVLFVQESRDPSQAWLPALPPNVTTGRQSLLWTPVPGGRWGSAIWVREGHLMPLPVPVDFTGRVVAAVIKDRAWPLPGTTEVVALSIHAPTRKGSTYIKEVDRILDFASVLAAGRSLLLAGDFNVAVGMREPEHRPSVSRGEQALLHRLGDDLGLIPCWQTAHPGEPLARTLRWMHRLDSLPYHCDGIFMPAQWASSLQSCDVLESEEWHPLSDHNPVVATVGLAAVGSP